MSDENRKERNEKYLFEERIIHESILSNDTELLRSMRYFSGIILVLLTVYIDWEINHKTLIIFISYAPFVLSIIATIVSFVFVQHALYKQREFNAEYYIDGIEESSLKSSAAGKIGGALIYVSIGLFIIGILLISTLMGFSILEVKGDK